MAKKYQSVSEMVRNLTNAEFADEFDELIQVQRHKEDEAIVPRLQGFISGLAAYARWEDGTEYVGTCGKTLQEAIVWAIEEAFSVRKKAKR